MTISTRSSRVGAVITCAGQGRRTVDIAPGVPKSLLPLSPLPTTDGLIDCALSRALSVCRGLGVQRTVIVGDGHAWFDRVAAATGSLVVGAPPTGEMTAIEAGIAALPADIDAVLVWSGDNLLDLNDVAGVLELGAPGVVVVGVAEAPDCVAYTTASVVADPSGLCRVIGLVEKGVAGPGLAKLGIYHLAGDAIAALLSRRRLDRFGEWSTTEALRVAIEVGIPVVAAPMPGGFVDVGSPASYREVVHGTWPRLRSAHRSA